MLDPVTLRLCTSTPHQDPPLSAPVLHRGDNCLKPKNEVNSARIMTTATDSVESAPAQRSDSPPEPMSSVPISLTPPPPPPDVNNEGEAVIEADPHAPNVDDGYASASDGGSAASTSISSSIRDYNFENRRRYHKFKEGRYFLPNDDIEQEREYMKHAMVMNLCEGRLHYAPLENPQKILDVGTGIGIWAIDSELPGVQNNVFPCFHSPCGIGLTLMK